LLDRALSGLRPFRSPDLIVGFEGNSDAGVYRLSDELALVQTVDFFTPIVDDPFTFGAIAATNALSDVYAMGATPVTAMNIVAFPKTGIDGSVLRSILEGGISVLEKAEVSLAGGHSVADTEIKYGLAVTGLVHPGRMIRNTGMRAGDVLVLTKSLGTGLISTAAKAGRAAPESLDAAIRVMTTLNREASLAMRDAGVHACTDVTGFGFIGHLAEMAVNSGLSVEVETRAIPLLPGALEYIDQGLVPAGAYANRDYRGCMVSREPSVTEEREFALYDPQTSGGLLIAVAQEGVERLLARLAERHVEAWPVGRAREGTPTRIHLI